MAYAISTESTDEDVRCERIFAGRCRVCGSENVRAEDYGNDHCRDCGYDSEYPDARIPFRRPGDDGAHDRYQDYPEL